MKKFTRQMSSSKTTIGTLVLAASLWFLAGCGEPEPKAQATTPPPSTTPTTPSVTTNTVGKRFALIERLKNALEAGTTVRCTGYKEIENPINARARASCTDSITLGIYDDKQDAKSSVLANAETVVGILGETAASLVGEDWSVGCGSDVAQCEEIQKALGGELLVTKPE